MREREQSKASPTASGIRAFFSSKGETLPVAKRKKPGT
jgi:hypothetical protein